MKRTNLGRKNALLGGLLVFLVPIIAVSIVYFAASRLPKGKELPILQSTATVGDWKFTNSKDTIENGSLWRDLKILFWVNNQNFTSRIGMMEQMIQFAQNQPEFTIKDPYPQIYLLAISDNQPFSIGREISNLNMVTADTVSPALRNRDAIYLIDRLGNIRGQYQFTDEDLGALYTDTQYLLQDTFYENADSLRIKRVFKSEIDEE